MTEIIPFHEPLTSETIERVCRILKADGVLVYPTDTVYGVGCVVSSTRGISRIGELKQRPKETPYSIAVSEMMMAKEYGVLDEETRTRIEEKAPGPYTFIVDKKDAVPEDVTAGKPTVGIRIPDHPPLLALIAAIGEPVITTSANRSGDPAPRSLADIDDAFFAGVDLALDGGPCPIGKPSTIIDMTGEGDKVLRK